MDMPVMNGVKCPAVKPYAQGDLLIEAKNDIQKECEYSKGDKAESIRRKWEFANNFSVEHHHE
jgi:hypothetical protein